MPYYSPGMLVFFLLPKISAKFKRRHFQWGAPVIGGAGKNWRFLTNISLYLKNGTRYGHRNMEG